MEPLLSVSQLGIDDIQPHNMGWGDMPRAMATVESMTPEDGWALGERFTAADVVFGSWLDFSIRVLGGRRGALRQCEGAPKVIPTGSDC